MYNSYDDYFCVNMKIFKIEIVLEKSNEVAVKTNLATKDNFWEIVYFKSNKLDNRTNEISFEYNSKLILIEFKNIELNYLTNLKENIFIEYFHESLNVIDIGYKTVLDETVKNERGSSDKGDNSLPLLNMRYKFSLELEKIANDITINIEVPSLYLCLDPITLYLISIIYQLM